MESNQATSQSNEEIIAIHEEILESSTGCSLSLQRNSTEVIYTGWETDNEPKTFQGDSMSESLTKVRIFQVEKLAEYLRSRGKTPPAYNGLTLNLSTLIRFPRELSLPLPEVEAFRFDLVDFLKSAARKYIYSRLAAAAQVSVCSFNLTPGYYVVMLPSRAVFGREGSQPVDVEGALPLVWVMDVHFRFSLVAAEDMELVFGTIKNPDSDGCHVHPSWLRFSSIAEAKASLDEWRSSENHWQFQDPMSGGYIPFDEEQQKDASIQLVLFGDRSLLRDDAHNRLPVGIRTATGFDSSVMVSPD